jgi:hypothetical protein
VYHDVLEVIAVTANAGKKEDTLSEEELERHGAQGKRSGANSPPTSVLRILHAYKEADPPSRHLQPPASSRSPRSPAQLHGRCSIHSRSKHS